MCSFAHPSGCECFANCCSRKTPAAACHHRLRRHRRRSAPRADPRLRTHHPEDPRASVCRRPGRHRGSAGAQPCAQDRVCARTHHSEIGGCSLRRRSCRRARRAASISSLSMRRQKRSSRWRRRCAGATCFCSTPPRRRIGYAASSARARDRAHAAEPRHEHGRPRTASRVAQMARHSRAAGPGAGRRAMTRAFESVGQEIRRAHRRASAISSPAPIRANVRRTIRCCSPRCSRDYDVIFIADDAFDFARQLPYQTLRARPVVGSIDLEPVAWHWTWERHGAPQVNSRFQRAANGRRMESAGLGRLDRGEDGGAGDAAHAFGRFRQAARVHPRRATVSTATRGSRSACGPGTSSCGRRCFWPRLMRWSASAPIEGFLHRTNMLDTLGDDERETPCKLNR